jgi:hypothetical protein
MQLVVHESEDRQAMVQPLHGAIVGVEAAHCALPSRFPT